MRRHTAVLTAAGVLLMASACSGPEPEAAPVQPVPVKHKVTFYAEGAGAKWAAVTMRTESGGTRQFNPDLPMTTEAGEVGLTSDTYPSGAQLYFSMQNKEGYGSVTCRILVDDKKVDEVTSSGGYAIAMCQGKVP